MDGTPVDTCPLCGAKNDCAVARGDDTCWCFDAVIPTNLLERVPEPDQGRVCVCRTCVERAQRATHT